MSVTGLSHIRGVVWDLDGTLYRYTDNFLRACNVAAARTAIALGLEMEEEAAISMAAESERKFGNSFRLFAGRGIRYEDFHDPYHKAVDEAVLEKNHGMRRALDNVSLPMIVLTNASKDWARRTLIQLDLYHKFGDGFILGVEDAGFVSKSAGPTGFEKALSVIGVKGAEALMVEDLPANLVHAKGLGMTTALVHHANHDHAEDAAYGHIDHHFDDTIDLLRLLAK